MPSSEHEAMVEQIIAQNQRTPETPPSAEMLAAARAAETTGVPSTPDDVRLEAGELGGVPCLVMTPKDAEPTGTIVFLHGGGYIWMRAHTHVPVALALVRATGCRCVNVDYRRAPEHPFPAAVEDFVAVYSALLADGTASDRIALAGDSAGGGLVLGGLVALRDEKIPLPAAAVSISPWTDLAVTGESADTADDPVVNGAGLRMMADLYLDGAAATTPAASPLYADLSGLPPLLIQVGTRESLLDDARRVATRAKDAGVDVTLQEFAGVVHMWIVIGPDIPESVQAFHDAGEFIRRHIT